MTSESSCSLGLDLSVDVVRSVPHDTATPRKHTTATRDPTLMVRR